MKEVEQLVPQ